jgi:ketosteroid isomerase-like protein
VEWHWQDVQTATGKSSSADDAIVVEFHNAKISRLREYIDIQGI